MVGLFTGRKFNPVAVVSDAIRTTVPVLGKLMGVGMFIQVMTLTGVRGYIVVTVKTAQGSVRKNSGPSKPM